MKKRKLRIAWTCSDYAHHEHRTKIGATLCGKTQFIRRELASFLIDVTDAYWERFEKPNGFMIALDRIADWLDPNLRKELRKALFGDLYDDDPGVMLKNLNDDLEAKLREYAEGRC